MTPENFCYWLQGWFELNRTIDHQEGATQETMKMIETHLGYVFKEIELNKTTSIAIDGFKASAQSERLVNVRSWRAIPT